MKFNQLFLLIGIVFFSSFASAADYQCVFDNSIAHINCNLAGASATFCQLSGPGPVANNPAVATTCINSTPTNPGQVVCTLRNYNGSVNSIRCSNTLSFVSGPTLIGGASGGCSYNDCELNQISCASGYAFQQCVPDPSSSGCNKWQATNCVGNAACYSTTNAQLATCAGIPGTQIESRNGVYFVTSAGGNGSPPSPPAPPANPPVNPPANQPGAQGSYTFNGKTYYVVRSDAPNGNTGNEVCQSIGKTCVGYTAFTSDVCKYFHPSASVTTTVNGSKAGFYCNGPPQTGLACGSSFNNCQICPQCNVNVTCGEEIGGLFREMYVECAGAGNKYVQLNFFGDGVFNITFLKSDGSQQKFGVEVRNSVVVQSQDGELPNPVAFVVVSESAVQAISNSPDAKKEVKNQLDAGGIQYTPVGIIEQIKFFFFRLFLGFF